MDEVTVYLAPEDVAVIRALNLVAGRPVDDLAGRLVALVRDAGRRHGLGHVVVGKGMPAAPVETGRPAAQLRAAGRRGAQRARAAAADRARAGDSG